MLADVAFQGSGHRREIYCDKWVYRKLIFFRN
jgi:hypothetical protein